MVIHGQALLILGIPIWILIRSIIVYFNKRKGYRISLKRESLLFVFYVYVLCVISITLFPLYITDRYNVILSANLIPVVGTIKGVVNSINDPYMRNYMIKFWVRNIGGNTVLLLPMGIFLPLIWSKFRRAGKVTLFAFLFSLTIEVLQLLSCYLGNMGRAFDIDDILLNTLGAFIGITLYTLYTNKINPKHKPEYEKEEAT